MRYFLTAADAARLGLPATVPAQRNREARLAAGAFLFITTTVWYFVYLIRH